MTVFSTSLKPYDPLIQPHNNSYYKLSYGYTNTLICAHMNTCTH
jgi:hypothetical protein